MRALLGLVPLAIVLSACGGAAPPPAVTTASSTAALRPGSTSAANPLPANAIRRSAVQAVLSAGPGAFLQSLAVDEHPIFVGGKFHGFRIAALHGDTWTGVDLRPGDVVTKINGFSIEHPEDAAEAFYSLRVASELRVEYEREGVPREIRYGIVDDGAPAPAPAARHD